MEALKNKSLSAENKRLETENAQKRSEIALEQEELERGKTTLAKERHALEAKSDALIAKNPTVCMVGFFPKIWQKTCKIFAAFLYLDTMATLSTAKFQFSALLCGFTQKSF